MKKTFKELCEVDSIVNMLMAGDATLVDTKFGYSYKRFYEMNLRPTVKEYKEALQDVRIKFALENKEGKLVTDESVRGFGYSKQGTIDVVKAERELDEQFENKEIEVEPFISQFVPKMNDLCKDILSGLLI